MWAVTDFVWWLLAANIVVLAIGLGAIIGRWSAPAPDAHGADGRLGENATRSHDEMRILRDAMRLVSDMVRRHMSHVEQFQRTVAELRGAEGGPSADRVDAAVAELERFNADLVTRLTSINRELNLPAQGETDGAATISVRPGVFSSASNGAGGAAADEDRPAEPGRLLQDDRRTVRYPYHRSQYVASYEEGHVPEPGDFRQVECHEISTGGLSYLCRERPLSQFLVISLGDEERPIYMKVRVAHVRDVCWQGKACFRVGCEFLERLEELLPA